MVVRTLTVGYVIAISDIPVEVVRKPIKHLYIRIDPLDGRVRVSAPIAMDEQSVRRAVTARLGWIRCRRQQWAGRQSEPVHEIVTGETHYVQGRPYRLNVVERSGRAAVRVAGHDTVELRARPGTDTAGRRSILEQWYRQILADEIPGLIREWQPTLGVQVAEWRIRRMKTRWGTCNIHDRRIWVNLALARKPRECLEYVLVHEMVHLLERLHNARFHAYMDRFMPDWRMRRDRLSAVPQAPGGRGLG